MIKVSKEYLHAYAVVVARENYPQYPWIAKTFISNELGKLFPEELTKERFLKRFKGIPSEYYAWHKDSTSFYSEYAFIAEQLIERVEKLTS